MRRRTSGATVVVHEARRELGWRFQHSDAIKPTAFSDHAPDRAGALLFGLFETACEV